MIQLKLSADKAKEGVALNLPATPAEVDEACAWFKRISIDPAEVRIIGASSSVRNLGQYISHADVHSAEDLEKLNALARKVNGMDRQQEALFSGALDAESINGMDDVLELADNLDRYILLHGVTTDRELGAFLVDSGYKDFPERVRPYLDYAGIGAEYYAEHGGAYTSAGYIQRRESTQVQSENDGAVFRLFLHTDQGSSFRLSLPAEEEELNRALSCLDIDDFTQCRIDRTDCLPYLAELIPNECISVEDANDLACGIDDMRQWDGQLLKYLSVLAVEQPETFTAAYHLAMELDDYERMPDDLDEYGRTVLRRTGMSEEQLNTIDGYMDFALLGQYAMQEDGTRRTEFGLVRRCSKPFPEETQEMQMGGM